MAAAASCCGIAAPTNCWATRRRSAQIERGDFKFRLHGEKLRGEFALVLMRGRGKGNEWLLIKKKDAEAKPGWNIEDHARSVLTGRTQQEIAEDLPPRPSHQPPATSSLATLAGAVQVANAAHGRAHARHARRRIRPPAMPGSTK